MSFLRWLVGPVGLMCWMAGFVGFLTLPMWTKPTSNRKFAGLHLWFSQFVMGRTAIVVSEHGDLLHKKMQFSDLGVEKIKFNDETKLFENVDDALSHWGPGRFALADEVHGLLFTPYHCSIGKRKHQSEEEQEMFAKATDDEWSAYNVSGWVKGVFSMPKKHELVDLANMRYLVTGSERAEWPQRVTEYYKNSREPYGSGLGAIRPFLPVIAFLAVFAGMWIVADQGGAATSSVSFGSLALLLAIPSGDRLKQVDWKRLGLITLGVTTPVGILALIAYLASPVLAAYVVVALVMGFTFIPFLAILARPVDKLGGAFGEIFLKTGFLGYGKPVFEFTPEGYKLREYDDLDSTAETQWYKLAGSLVGFTYTPDPDAYPEALEKSDIEDGSEIVTDGSGDSNIPPGHTRSEQFSRADYGAFVPKRPKSTRFYVAAGRALKRLSGGAEGDKCQSRLEWAKEKFGVNAFKMSNKMVAILTFAAIVLAAGLGTFLFFLG